MKEKSRSGSRRPSLAVAVVIILCLLLIGTALLSHQTTAGRFLRERLIYGTYTATDVAEAVRIKLGGATHGDTAGAGIALLMYHHLAPAGSFGGTSDAQNKAILDVENFESQMAWLAEQGYQTLHYSELGELLVKGQPLPEKTVLLTFDDGYESNYTYAYPILRKYGLKANIAVVGQDTFEPNTAPPHGLPHCTPQQLREMQQSGVFEIASHSYAAHGGTLAPDGKKDALLTTRILSSERQQGGQKQELESRAAYRARIRADLLQSKNVLEQALGQQVTTLVYPFGKHNAELRRAARQVGFSYGVTTAKGRVTQQSDPMRLPRINIDNTCDLTTFSGYVTGK